MKILEDNFSYIAETWYSNLEVIMYSMSKTVSFFRKIFRPFIISVLICCWSMSAAKGATDDTAAVSKNLESVFVFEGKITRASKLPDPLKSSYKDCYYTAEFEVLNVISGILSANQVIVVFPGFHDRKLTPEAKFKVNDLLRLKLVPFDSLPQEAQSIQQADELENFSLAIYFAKEIAYLDRIPTYLTKPPPRKSISYVSGFEKPLNPTLPQTLVDARKAEIQHDLASVKDKLAALAKVKNNLAASFSHDWQTFQESLVEVKSLKGGSYKWGEVGKGHFTLPMDYNPFTASDWNGTALSALKSLNEYLSFNNIQLIVVVIPDRFQVASRVFLPQYADHADQVSLSIVKTLLENDIEAIDISRELVSRAKDYPFMFFYDKIHDPHPDYGAVDVATDKLAERLKRFIGILPRGLPSERFSLVDVDNPLKRTWPVDSEGHKIGELLHVKQVLFDGKVVDLKNQASPFLVIGDSFSGTPGWGAFSCFTGMKTGIIPYHCEIGGTGVSTTIPKMLLAQRRMLLKGKKACFLPIGIYPLSQKGWLDIKIIDQKMSSIAGAHLVTTIPRVRLFEAISTPVELTGKDKDLIERQKGKMNDQEQDYTFFKLPSGKTTMTGLHLPTIGNGMEIVIKIVIRSIDCPTVRINVNGQVAEEKILIEPSELFFQIDGREDSCDISFSNTYPLDTVLGIKDIEIYQQKIKN
ncbi:MAG: hypothetical protein WAX69_01740 [Victivallales bacterium]